MLELRLIRITPEDKFQEFTHGELFMKDHSGLWLSFCYTLEDKVRDYNMDGDFDDFGEGKVYGETAIPFGKYNGQVTYSNKFKREMPAIFNVRDFTGIRIHGGNTIKDTLGCVLVAHKTDYKGRIWSTAERDLTKLIKANDSKGRFKIEVI